MDASALAIYLTFGFGLVFAVLGWLLNDKDKSLQKQIELLFEKHDLDVAMLQTLRLEIASQHYVKGELDSRFDKLEVAITKGMDSLGGKFDQLAKSLIDHMNKEDARP